MVMMQQGSRVHWMMMGWLGTSSSTSSLVPDYGRCSEE
jgi:hypothetical protein